MQTKWLAFSCLLAFSCFFLVFLVASRMRTQPVLVDDGEVRPRGGALGLWRGLGVV